ncbi:retropepsin-like aspartic protease [Flavilitoribacter nigricans]|uniref:Peptidase A2 domain-containing protein n=1 Tax=Flavilitoribacter nigricans (strain ATCC 23147 / DSM 23189 / NBRC 102662 / NCIMB 1420 / SS-2) TaxID=1122177 RepID=A0A2D0N7Q6_FLAN2|nr:retropepsin-like aspartic protease [Flavilitoribacter nigricans]PHN04420.1 hypothetical protein CRP01_20640 [Flavilitoribacter nigricans DSM 23189 = NBRC 102662]
MKTPITLFFCLAFLAGLNANYLIDGPVAELSIQTEGKMILIPGIVDGVEGYFMLDTGAPELILNERYFPERKVGRKKVLQDVGKKMSCAQIRVEHFIMGNVYRDNFEAIITDLHTTEKALGRPILGLLGYDVLRHFEVRIDYYGGFITFCNLDEAGRPVHQWQKRSPDHQLEFIMEGHLPTIEGQLLGKSNLMLGLDSGASVNLMDQSYRGYLRKHCLKEREIDFQCINSKVEAAPFFVMPQLEVENAYQVQFWRTSIGDFSHFRSNDIYIQGILGANFFQLGLISINYQMQTIKIWDEPARINRRYICLNH